MRLGPVLDMTLEKPHTYITMSTAQTVRQLVERAPPGTFFRASDFADAGSGTAVAMALSRLHDRGVLQRPRQGLYWKGVDSIFGPGKPKPLSVAYAVLGTDGGVGPTGWTATNALGLSTQVPARPQIAATAPAPTSVPGVKVTTRFNQARRRLAPMDIALLETLRTYPRFAQGGWSTFVDRVRQLADDQVIHPQLVADVARTERSVATRKNAQRLLSDLATTRSGPGVGARTDDR